MIQYAPPAGAHSPHDSIHGIAVSPDFAQDRTVYAIVRSYLLKSTDGGETWKRLVRGLDHKRELTSLGISHQDPQVLYVSSRGDGVYKSTDGGASWGRVTTGLERHPIVVSIVVSPRSHDVVFAVDRDGTLLSTTNGGSSWEPVSGPQQVTAVAFAPDDPDVVVVGDARGGVQRSNDGGRTWTETGFAETAANSITAVAVSPAFSIDRTFFVGTRSDGVYATDDGGGTFSVVSSGLTDRRVTALALSPTYPSDSTLWAVSWEEGVFVSEDAGSSWSSADEGLTTNPQADLLHRPHFDELRIASPPGPDERPTMFLAGFDGLFRSSGTSAWEELDTQVASNIAGLAVAPGDAGDDTIAIATYLNGAFLSRDGGETWSATNKGLATKFEWTRRSDYVARLVGIWFSPTYTTDDRMFASSRGRLLTSTDGGEVWTSRTPRGLLAPDEHPPDYMLMAFSPAFEEDGTVLLGTNRGKVFHSDDGGRSYSMVADLEREITALVLPPGFDGDGRVFVGTADGLLLGSYEDDTWSEVDEEVTGLAVSTTYDRDGTAFLGTPNGLFVTRDAATNWTRLTGTPFTEVGYIEAVALSPAYGDDGTMLVSVRGEGLFRSTDGGQTFAPVAQALLDDNSTLSSFYHPTSPPIAFSPAFAVDQTVYGIAQENLFRSTDGGDTWEPVEFPVTRHDTDEAAAPAPLLETPRADTNGVRSSPDSRAFRTPLGDLSVRRFAAAAVAGILTFLLLWPLQRTLRTTDRTVAIRVASSLAARIAVSLVVFVAALVVLAA
jgi:photosystem II stability/assembly factor-like uncharacterized protein